MSNLICFVMYYLGTYPEVRKRLQQEIETVFGKDLIKPITIIDLDKLKYCDAEIVEFAPSKRNGSPVEERA